MIDSKPQNWIDSVTPNIRDELQRRTDELSRMDAEQIQIGTAVPQLYGALSRFIANPSTVSVETYKRMLDTDETIGSGIDFMNLCMVARFGEYTHPIPSIQKFVRRALEQMEGSWHQNLDEMFSAEWAGFSTTEQVWDFVADFDGAPAYVPRKLITYQPLTMVFAVDRQGEVLPDGIYQYQRYHNAYMGTQTFGAGVSSSLDGFRPDLYASVGDFPYPIRISADLTYLTVKIPKDKVIHMRSSSTGKFNNPYGRSILRRIYKNWVIKDAFLKMWMVAADRKGTPLVVGYAAPNDTVLEQSDGSDPNNAVKPQRADQAMAEAFRNVHNSSFIVFPGRKGEVYDIEKIDVQGDMNVFKDGVDYFNRAIMRGMLIPALILGGDGGGSYSLGQEHHKIFEKIIDGKLKPYKQNLLESFIRKIIAYNFPKAMWEKHGLGDFALEEYDEDAMSKLSGIFRDLTDGRYLSPENQADMDFVRQKIGAPKGKAAAAAEGGSLADMLGIDNPSADPTDSTGAPVDENASEADEIDPAKKPPMPVPGKPDGHAV